MPTYQYSCTECGHFFEQVQSFSDDALTTCPECAGRLRKVFNAVGVVFKGSGFYRTDSRKDSSASAGSGAKGKDGDGAAKPAAAASSSASTSSDSPAGKGSGSSANGSGSSSTKSTTSGSAA